MSTNNTPPRPSQPYEKYVPVVTEHGIYGFFKEYRWLSNFHECKIPVAGIAYPSTEAAYMSFKTDRLDQKIALSQAPTSADAKKLGRVVSLRENWDDVKIYAMYTVNKLKYTMYPQLAEKLLSTENLYLEETNHWKDTFWGVCESQGHNYLGRVLMRIRYELQVSQEQERFEDLLFVKRKFLDQYS